jgi:paraquat-inducible protein B
MSKRANPALIGGFVLVALVLLVGALVYFGSGSLTGEQSKYIVYFRANVAGLQVGAPVVLKGVRIGTVDRIRVGFFPEGKDFIVPVVVKLDSDKVFWPKDTPYKDDDPRMTGWLIKKGLRARLALQSIVTGQLMIELGFYPDTEVKLHGGSDKYLEFPSVPSDMETLIASLGKVHWNKMFTAVERTIEGIDRLVNAPEIMQVLDNLSQAAISIRETARTVESESRPIGDNINKTLVDIQALVKRVEQQVTLLGENLDGVVTDTDQLVRKLDYQLTPVLTSIRRAADAARVAFDASRNTMASVDNILGEDSPLKYELMNLLKNLSDAARSLKSLTDYLDRHPEALLKGKPR